MMQAVKKNDLEGRPGRVSGVIPGTKELQDLKELVRRHIQSYDLPKRIKPVQILDSFTEKKLRIWFDNPEIQEPQKERASGAMGDRLYPFEINICCRHPRNAIIGDKFSSRHGQKGVCSQLWPVIDMPFSGLSGMRPDLLINPRAFPSRMTIGMVLESVVAKGGSLHGKFVDATPFSNAVRVDNGKIETQSSESLVDELGSMLRARGFNYHGTEVLYSGVYGTELTCEIFIGPVYYQRLRHMVSDKFQVNCGKICFLGLIVCHSGSLHWTSSLDYSTANQRKCGGGIHFGEMERDSMLAHGAAYLLHERLHTCSDHHIADVCSLCGSILTASLLQPQKRAVQEIGGLPPARAPKKVTCCACKTSKGMETVAMSYVFRYLAAELAAMNIKVTLQLSSGPGA